MVGLTTITGDEWKNKVKEIDKLGIKELALFPTCLDVKQRKDLYKRLEKTGLKIIPHIHIRHDFESWEFDYLTKRYKTKVFNIHPYTEMIGLLGKNTKYKNKIFVENLFDFTHFWTVTDNCGGVCLDISHWEDYGVKQKKAGYNDFVKRIKKLKIGCNHISGVSEKKNFYYYSKIKKKVGNYSNHWLNDLNEMDYVKKYKKYLSDIISIELENSFKEQLKVKQYLEKILEI